MYTHRDIHQHINIYSQVHLPICTPMGISSHRDTSTHAHLMAPKPELGRWKVGAQALGP